MFSLWMSSTFFNPVCLLKISGDKIWLGPVIPALNTAGYLASLQERLKHNNPTLALTRSLFPNHNLCIPCTYEAALSTQQLAYIKEALNKQLSQAKPQISIINIDTLTTQHHPLLLPADHEPTFSEQVQAKITINNCPVNFDQDGGSRSISPEETVQRIRPLISPITGIITHISPLKESENAPIKIYSSAFFKTPALKDSDKLNNQSFIQSCLGKGVSHIQSQASALCEAIERYSALYQGDEPLLLSKQSALSQRSYHHSALVPYSEKQYSNFADKQHPDSTIKQAALPYQNTEIHWLPSWSLSHQEQVFLPLASCFANIPFHDDQFGQWNSNGCAAGNTLEEAILQGLFELIERDAIAIWWYNKISRPSFDIDKIEIQQLKLLKSTLDPTHYFWLLDLTTDIAIPVMVAVGQHKENGGYSFGFGCHLQPELAAQRALTELCQLIPIRDQNEAPFDFNAIVEGEYLHSQPALKSIKPFTASSGDIKDDILNIVVKLNELGFETLVLNYSRSHLPIKTAKVTVPGLCHIWPQLANERLYQLPLTLGWLQVVNTESTINQQALYI